MTALGWLLSPGGWELVRNRCYHGAAAPQGGSEPNSPEYIALANGKACR